MCILCSWIYLKTMTSTGMKGIIFKVWYGHIVWMFTCNFSRNRVIIIRASKSYAVYCITKVFTEFSEMLPLGSKAQSKRWSWCLGQKKKKNLMQIKRYWHSEYALLGFGCYHFLNTSLQGNSNNGFAVDNRKI